ncbi:MAG: phage holin family protein [Clostridia bacterium]|jgi:predicted membrane protein
MEGTELWSQFVQMVDGMKLWTLGIFILVNFILGVAVSIKNKKFNLKTLGEFLGTKVVPYILGYYAVGMVALIEESWKTAVPVVWGGIVLTLLGAILQNLKELGINIPTFLAGGKDS